MQASQRAEANPALEYAIRWADEINGGVVVGFGLFAAFPDANARHFAFIGGPRGGRGQPAPARHQARRARRMDGYLERVSKLSERERQEGAR